MNAAAQTFSNFDLMQAILGLGERIASLEKPITNMGERIAVMEKCINTIELRLESLEVQVQGMQKRLQQVENGLQELTSTVHFHTGSLRNMQTVVDRVSNEQKAQTNDIANAFDRLVRLEEPNQAGAT